MKKLIKSFEEACKKKGISTALPIVDMLPERNRIAIVAHYKLMVITEVLNEDWVPDWTNGKWDKYYPWFSYESGVGFSFAYYDDWHANTIVGSRLCFKSSELAKYAGTQFKDLYNEYFLIN